VLIIIIIIHFIYIALYIALLKPQTTVKTTHSWGKSVVPLTRVPEQLDSDAHPPPLPPRHAPHKAVTNPGVGTLAQPQLSYDIINLRQIYIYIVSGM